MRRILVPLLEARDSRALVPLVSALARGEGAVVRCVHVRSIPGARATRDGRVVATPDQEMARLTAEALADRRVADASRRGVTVESVVRFGRAAQEILVEAEAWNADLIALMGAHGTWLRRLGIRGAARAVLRRATVPVVFYRPWSPPLAERLGQRLEALFRDGLPGSDLLGITTRW